MTRCGHKPARNPAVQ